MIVDLGSRGGALNAVEKARKVIGERLGDVRSWDELPVRHARRIALTIDGNSTTCI
ncbi:hypothetical protein NQU36_26575 [Escherichia coli]|nr:hypothetical protein [Escherichia coli]